jgi:alpha-glucosidase
MLHRTLCTALNLSLSGIAYTGPDIGGFSGDPSPELYTRWFQLAAWLPFFRSHSIFTMPSREPWKAAGPLVDAVRDAARQRYRLLPYLYTLAWAQAEDGDPLVAPVWWHTPDAAELLDVDDAFLVGPDVLVAPVLEQGATARTVRLPAGTWYELASGDVATGEVTVPVTIDAIPTFVRAGAVLPTDEDRRPVLLLHPPDGARRSRWYRDDGDGDGPHRVDAWDVAGDARTWTVTAAPDDRPDAAPRDDAELAVRLPGGRWEVAVDGAEPRTVEPGQPLAVGTFATLAIRRLD